MMGMGESLLRAAIRLGLRLTPRGDDIVIAPAKLCPPEFTALVRQHKQLVLDLLHARAEGLAPDEQPWFHIAKQVLRGEFANADDSTLEAIPIGLRAIPHSACGAAREKLQIQAARREP